MKAPILLFACSIAAIAPVTNGQRSDPILFSQPPPIRKACQDICPDTFYQILRIAEHQKVKPYTYTVTFFNTNGMIQCQKFGDDWISELPLWQLELAADGTVIEEGRHLISELAVPRAVMAGFKKWNPKGLKGMIVSWGVERKRNQKREFVASIVFNQVDGTGAIFLEDGTLVKEKSDPVAIDPEKDPRKGGLIVPRAG
jgi:hypothetical protein